MRAYIPHVGWLNHEPGDALVSLLRQGYFEATEQAFVWLYLRPGDCFIDCGAHIGLYSVLASRATGGRTRLISVEANPETARFLETNLRENEAYLARVVQRAVWKEPGFIRFLSEEPTRSAFARVSFEASEASVQIPATTLDELVGLTGADEVALVKLDVEGVEPEAIEGAAASLARGSCKVLMVEFTEANLQRRGWSTQRLGELLKDHGFRLHQMSPETLQLEPVATSQPLWFANLLALRDPERVAARLHDADPSHLEVARDILDRGQACSRFKELEDLETVRREAASNKQWALNIEGLLAGEKELAASNKQWALNIEALLAEERERSRELLARAEDAERRALPGKKGSQ